jgi:hypothetical protein
MVGWLACAGPACGWGWSVHRLIAFRAMQALAGERLLAPERAWPVLWKSVVAPDDRKARGYMPAEDHVFHVTPEAGGRRFGRAPRRAQEIAWRLTSEALDDEETLHELGRLCHLVADLCQPLHADGKRRNPREREVHAPYERDADRDARLGEVRGGAVSPPEPSSVEERMEALARASVRDYDAICAAYLDRLGGARGARDGGAVARGARAPRRGAEAPRGGGAMGVGGGAARARVLRGAATVEPRSGEVAGCAARDPGPGARGERAGLPGARTPAGAGCRSLGFKVGRSRREGWAGCGVRAVRDMTSMASR